MTEFRPNTWKAGLAAAALLALAACGGGAGAAVEPLAAMRQPKASTCDYQHVTVTVERLRLVRDSGAGATSVELAPAAPQPIDLVAGGDLLSRLGVARLGAGQYSGLRLIVAAGDGAANTVQAGGAAPAALAAQAAAHVGLAFDGQWTVPPGSTGELVLQGFDACRSVVAAGNSGRYVLRPRASAILQVRLAPAAAESPPLVREYTVNTSTEGVQVNPAAARLAGGGHVVAWQSGYPAAPAVCSQAYGLDGLPGTPQSCLTDSGVVAGPVVAPLAAGGHALAWTVALPESSYVRTRAIGAAGSALSSVQTANTSATGHISDLSMAAVAGGGYVVAWRSLDPGAVVSVRMRRFGEDGSPLGDERIVIATGALDAQLPAFTPSALAMPDGGFGIAWARRAGTAGGNVAIYLQRFAASGEPLAEPTLLVQGRGSTNLQALRAGLLMAYRREGLVRLQRLGLDGTVLGPELTPYPDETPPAGCLRYTPQPTPCTVIQDLPTTAALDDGGYVVAWESLTVPYLGATLWARRFGADDAPRAAASQLASGMTQHAVAGRGDGGFVIAWRAPSTTSAADWADILARQYSASGLLAGP